jgi:hypothetical protein
MNLNPTREHVCGGTLVFQGYMDNKAGQGPSFKCDKCGEEMFDQFPVRPLDRVEWTGETMRDHLPFGTIVLVKIKAGDLFQIGIQWDGDSYIIALPRDDWSFWSYVRKM